MTGAGTLTTRCCSFRLEPEGYVRATMGEGAMFELADAVEAIRATWHIAGERRRAVLVDMRGVRTESRDAREYFLSEETAQKMKGVALLVGSPLSRMVGNFFVRIGDHRVPTRLFTSEDEAVRWLVELDG